jgi:hypothetical protein
MGYIQGEVTSANETTKDGKDRYGVKLGGEWFNGFGKCPVKKGDKVNIEYITNGKWQNITNIIVEAPSVKTNKSPPAGDRVAGMVLQTHKPTMNPPSSSDLLDDLIDLVQEETLVTNVMHREFQPEFAINHIELLRAKMKERLLAWVRDVV